MLLQKNEQSLPALESLKEKITELNRGTLLPPGMHINTIYDRTRLIDLTTHTVKHVILTGLFLVTLILLLMLGDLRTTLIAAATIPFAVLFSFSMMALTGNSANLTSISAIDSRGTRPGPSMPIPISERGYDVIPWRTPM